MSSLSWKINRIKAMSLSEIIFRIRRLVEVRYEKSRIRRGWKPTPKDTVMSGAPLYAQDLNQIQRDWHECFGEFNRREYETALVKVNLFENSEVDISNAIDWHYDFDTGVRAPLIFGKDIDYRDNSQVGNCKTLWELSRHKHLVPLAVAYVMTGDSKYIEKIVEHIEGWIDQNPYGIGAHWCSSLEVSLRLIAWCFVHNLVMLRDRSGLFDRVGCNDSFSESVYQHAYFIVHYLSRHSSANNHLIGELTGLWLACKTFSMGKDGEVWAKLAKNELEREADKQVFSDGVSREQSTYYHHWVNEYLLLCWLVGQRYGDEFSNEFSKRVSKMTQFLVDLKPTDGQMPQIGDSDDGRVVLFDPTNRVNSYEDLVSSVKLICSRDRQCDSGISEKAFWYRKIVEDGSSFTPTLPAISFDRKKVKVYRDGGYVVVSDSIFHSIFDAGNLGYPSIAAHGHADAMSLTVAWDGNWWLVDPGTYCYHTEPEWRDYFRGTGAHNTVYMGKTDQSLIGGPFLWLNRSNVTLGEVLCNDNIRFGGEVEGYAKNRPNHKRLVEYSPSKKELNIEDSMRCEDDCEFEVRFHFHPDVRLERRGVFNYIAKHKSSSLSVNICTDNHADWNIFTGEIEPIIGWYSEALGAKVPCNVLVGSAKVKFGISIKTNFTW